MNIAEFCKDYGVSFLTEGHHHCAKGWIQFHCPFCKSSNWHLGYNIQKNFFCCWRCGFHPLAKTIAELAGISINEANSILGNYKQRVNTTLKQTEYHTGATNSVNRVSLPYGSKSMSIIHREYLSARGFNPRTIAEDWGVMGVGNMGAFKFRLIIPVYFHGTLVSYTSRSIVDKISPKYIHCSKEEELVSIKQTLYGYDKVADNNKVIITEGVTDVWRLGKGAVAVYGIQFTLHQVNLLRGFKERYILFDSDPQAQKQGEKLANMLAGFKGHTEIITLESGDPADLSVLEAKKLKKAVLKI